MKHATTLLIGILLILHGCSLEDSIPNDNIISGTVKNSSEVAISGVTVKLQTLEKEYATKTDDAGNYSFKKLDSGLGILHFAQDDYYEITKKIAIGQEKHQTIDIVLRNFEDEYFLSSTPENSILFENTDIKYQLIINTNGSFKVKCISDWLTCSPLQSGGSEIIELTFEANETDFEKEATITIEGQYGKSLTIEVKQKAGPIFRMLSMKNPEFLGDVNNDGIEMEFNLPVNTVTVYNSNVDISSSLNISKQDEEKTIKISGFELSPFQKTEYNIEIKSYREELLKEKFEVSAYLKHFPANSFGGEVFNHFILPDGNYCEFQDMSYGYLHSWPDMTAIRSLPSFGQYYSKTYTRYLNSFVYVSSDDWSSKHRCSFYDVVTGNLKKEIEIEFPSQEIPNDKEYIQSFIIMENGMALISTGYRMYKVDFSATNPVPIEFEEAGILRDPHQWSSMPDVNNLIDNERKILCSTYVIDTQTWGIKSIAPKGVGNNTTILGGKYSNQVLMSIDGYYYLVNSDTGTYNEIGYYPSWSGYIVEKQGKITHIIFSDSNSSIYCYVYNVETRKIQDINIKGVTLCLYPGSYPNEYLFAETKKDGCSTKEYYVIPVNYFTNYAKP